VDEEEARKKNARQQPVGIEEREERAVIAVGIDGQPAEEVAEGPPRKERGRKLPTPIPRSQPFFRGPSRLGPELDGDAAHDQGKLHEQQGRVEEAEERGVSRGKRGERRASGGQQPDFIAVPDRAQGAADRAIFGSVRAMKL